MAHFQISNKQFQLKLLWKINFQQAVSIKTVMENFNKVSQVSQKLAKESKST